MLRTETLGTPSNEGCAQCPGHADGHLPVLSQSVLHHPSGGSYSLRPREKEIEAGLSPTAELDEPTRRPSASGMELSAEPGGAVHSQREPREG